jgi:amino acid transporter
MPPKRDAAESEKGNTNALKSDPPEVQQGMMTPVHPETTHRNLKSRHIQLIGIGGTIGTVLYVCFV